MQMLAFQFNIPYPCDFASHYITQPGKKDGEQKLEKMFCDVSANAAIQL